MSGVEFHVVGLPVVTRALQAAEAQVKREGTNELAALGALVEQDAEMLARGTISGLGRNLGRAPDWSAMRSRVTPSLVYVVPQQRGVRGNGPRRRRNFAPLLLNRAMRPALQRKRPEVLRRYQALVDRVCRRFNG